MAFDILKRELWYQLQFVRHNIGIGANAVVPHVGKRRLIRGLQRQYGPDVFIETGTYLGDMVAAQARRFRTVHSIELSATLFEQACHRFAGRKGIHLHHGDSGTVLPEVLSVCDERALFWLDAHSAGGITEGSADNVPILNELDTILSHGVQDHVILIDDARLFTGQCGYPALMDVARFVKARRADLRIDVQSDVIRILPPGISQRTDTVPEVY